MTRHHKRHCMSTDELIEQLEQQDVEIAQLLRKLDLTEEALRAERVAAQAMARRRAREREHGVFNGGG